jgi:tetratricopeptide (TPR) repeat protein
MADLHLHSQDYQAKALEEFEDVLKMQPNNPAALRGLGYGYLQQRDFSRAREYFRKAAEADSKDARVYYYSALLTHEEGTFSRDPEKLAVMRKELETSIALDPSFADAYSLLAVACAFSGEYEPAVHAMKKAVELSPRNESYLYNLSLMYLSAGRVDDAITILRSLQNSSNPAVAMRSQHSLTEAQHMKDVIAAGGQFRNSDGVVVQRATAQQPSGAPVRDEPTEKPAAASSAVGISGPRRFLKGRIVDVDCSAPPAAVLTLVSANKTWKMRIADT